jgi:hypothetical protein
MAAPGAGANASLMEHYLMALGEHSAHCSDDAAKAYNSALVINPSNAILQAYFEADDFNKSSKKKEKQQPQL